MVTFPVKMTKTRKCILCETVHASKQEMDEHMRSMLHHRELEKLKGRDCGHECRVCKVSVVSLTDYASHISSAAHKQHLEALEKKPVSLDRNEDYFDQVLVDAIHKRKEQIRKEKEAAIAAQLAKQQEEARKKEFQQRLSKAKECYQLDRGQQHLPQGFAWSTRHNSWNNKQQPGLRAGYTPPWNNNKQGRSATWHAQAPPYFHRWASGDLQVDSFHSQDGWGGSKKWERSPFDDQNRLPWLSNQGSNYGMYGRNNISQCAPNNRPLSFNGPSLFPPPPQFFTNPVKNFQRKGEECRGPQREEMRAADCDQHSKKTFGSNPKLDKTCSWSKEVDVKPSKDTSETPKDDHTKGSKSQETTAAESEEAKPKSNPKSAEKRSSAQKDGHQTSTSGPSTHPNSGASAQPQSKPTTKQMGIRTPPVLPLPSWQEQKSPEIVRKSTSGRLAERRCSLDGFKLTVARQTEGEPLKVPVQGQITDNKDRSCRQNATKPKSHDPLREKLAVSSSESTHSLQSLHVSTSTTERLAPAGSNGDDPEKRPDKEALTSPPRDEATQDAEEGCNSESDTSRCGKTDLKASSASKLGRDLTKRVSTKTKTGGPEPNLNIARRVRNLSESRRSDTEKDSGLKPTVRQLISSSGSRRKVNWEQVYQEVRKKQDKGKGMPRFGIEMVPNDPEDQNQEEDDIAFLENFPWESLMETSSPAVSRKRSLSESSIAPASEHSCFSSCESNKIPQRQVRCSEQQRSSVSPKLSVPKENDSRPEAEQKLNFTLEEAQKQADKLMSEKAKAHQRSDSMLGDNSSGAEQMDTQGTAKRRRTPGDVLSQEAAGVEQDKKRRKIKSKSADRLQIDQLLAVSLREEELSRSLQTVDSNLIQARAALEAAYMEVQRFMVVKQQITTEMSTLREKRIDLLKGMQAGNISAALPIQLKEEKTEPVESSLAASMSSLTSAAAPPHPGSSSPQSSIALPVAIKQEPLSPVRVSSESQLLEAATLAEPTFERHTSVETKLELYQADGDSWSLGQCADVKDSLLGLLEPCEKAVQSTHHLHNLDLKTPVQLMSASSRRSSETGSLAERSLSPTFETPMVPNTPGSPCEMRSGKRVRKLKKRKVLEKAHGNVQPESSDTEMDAEASRPRWPRPNRRSSSSSAHSTQVSISSLPSGGDVKMEDDKEVTRRGMKPLIQPLLPETDTPVLTEEKMEVIEACQQPLRTSLSPPACIPDSSRTEQPSLACNEVTSTSDMDICKSSESEVSFPKMAWSSSQMSCGSFEGHQEAVNAMQVHNGLLYTCSGDRTIKALDLQTRKCVAVFSGHTSKVSCLLVSAAPCLQRHLYSGSSDQTIRCYNLKTQELEQQFSLADRVLCLHSRWKLLYAGLANGNVVTFDLTSNRQMDVFECHAPRAVSCLASYQEGCRRILLVGSYDSTISVRDAKTGLLLRTLEGHTKTVLCMKVVDDLVFSGSSDQNVFAHNIHSGELVRAYKGHSHAVTVLTVVGKVMVTACLDKLVRVYDLQSREQLQVYAGHSDMVTSMTVHQNKIYTGCYDGSVQAVELNLTQNYRCRWHGCSLVFGLTEHLQQHLVNDHAGANLQTLRCRWKDCEEFFCARNGSKQGMLSHVRKHAEEAEPEP
ncbi:zinc finger protein 106 [Dunckerocampus dactyliophorus]|uniref:zinc finger protein 106 n=1 Tax=Dunckerocampus dactyliophorus TaxID=161453 RepID=UPI002406DD0E|nr:zinc finger protein 106 [Dunckerocampus dactyliophorus]